VTALSGARLGTPRVHLRRTESTNTVARELAARGAPHGMVVTAAEQTAGRGRQGRAWSAPVGAALVCSLVIRDAGPLLSLAAGVAVAELAGERARVKWPNDVLIDGCKLAGILVEGRPQEHWAVLGIGINVALRPEQLPEDLRDRAATLGLTPADLEPTLVRLLDALEHWLHASDAGVLGAVRSLDALRGRAVTWEGGAGTAAGIDGSGRLLVARPDGSTDALDAGEVHLGAVTG
jgi:BirA family biotin operon repressor/biotin-[acetyl-CoA-carboxylase] ligase